MTNIFTLSFSGYDHPVSDADPKYRDFYIKTLYGLLCKCVGSSKKNEFIFDQWIKQIDNTAELKSEKRKSNLPEFKDFIKYHYSSGYNLNYIKVFFLDFFYFIQLINERVIEKSFLYISSLESNKLVKSCLSYTYDYVKGLNNGKYIKSAVKKAYRKHLEFQKKRTKRILVVGTMTAGKSTLLNAMVGHKICRMRNTVCTSEIHYIYNNPYEENATMLLNNGNLFCCECSNIEKKYEFNKIGLPFRSALGSHKICLIDTPGTNFSRDSSHGEMTRKIIRSNRYDLLVFVANACYLGTNDEYDLLKYISATCKRKVVCVLNKCDCYDQEEDSIRQAVIDYKELLSNLQLKEFAIIPMSAVGSLLFELQNFDELTELEKRHLRILEEIFSNEYYDMTKYSYPLVNKRNKQNIDKTGLNYLHYNILSI